MDLEQLKERVNADDGYMAFNGIQVTDVEKGFCRCRAEMSPERTNPHGIAHGGFLFTLCDTAAGVAGTSLGRGVVSRSADMHYLLPGRGSAFTAEGRVVQSGHSTALCAVELFGDGGELIATGSFELHFIGPVRG